MSNVLVTAAIFATERFVLCRAEDNYHGCFPSVDGWHAFTPEPASTDWIGQNLRRSLASARYVNLTPEQWDQALYDENRSQAEEVNRGLLERVGRQFGYGRRQSVLARALMVHVWWQKGSTGHLSILAMNRKRGGYEALANDPRQADKVLRLSFEADDHEIGTAVRQMLAVSTIAGERIFVSG